MKREREKEKCWCCFILLFISRLQNFEILRDTNIEAQMKASNVIYNMVSFFSYNLDRY